MNKIYTCIISLFVLLIIGCEATNQGNVLVIENITTIDPTEGMKNNQDVHISKGKIIKIEEYRKVIRNNNTIDGSGKYLIPGLWDAHVHYAFLIDIASRMSDLFLAFGITSVRDTGGDIDFVNQWKNAALKDPKNAPRIMIAGPLLDGLPNVYDGSDPGHPKLSVGLDTKEEIEEQINSLISEGVDLLKAYEMLTPDQFKTIMKLAKENSLKVTGHVPLSMDVISASDAGLNSMEHMRNLELSCSSLSSDLLEERKNLLSQGKKDAGGILRSRIHSAQRQKAVESYNSEMAEKVLNSLKANDTWQIPTLALNVAGVNRPYSSIEWQQSFQYLPDSIEQRWKKEISLKEEPDSTSFDFIYAQWKYDMVKAIYEKGIPIMAGTDCPISYLTPGRSLHQELIELEKAGIPPLDVLATATINPAKYFNLDDELGSIKEGMIADLLILNKNPLDKIENTLDIYAIFKDGNFINRSNIDQILSNLNKN